MSETPREFLKNLTSDELLNALHAEFDMHRTTPEERSLIDDLATDCPELLQFASAALDTIPDTETLSEGDKRFMLVNTAAILGAIYRVAQSRDLPQL